MKELPCSPSTSASLKQINEFHIPTCLAFPEAPAVSYHGHNVLQTEETCKQNESVERFPHLFQLSLWMYETDHLAPSVVAPWSWVAGYCCCTVGSSSDCWTQWFQTGLQCPLSPSHQTTTVATCSMGRDLPDPVQKGINWRMASSGTLCRVALVRTDVSEELSASSIRVTKIGEIGT
jgi:hypothetical protein